MGFFYSVLLWRFRLPPCSFRSEQGLDIGLYGLGGNGGFIAGYNLPFAVDKEFGEVPLDVRVPGVVGVYHA